MIKKVQEEYEINPGEDLSRAFEKIGPSSIKDFVENFQK